MAAVPSPADNTTELLQNLSLNSQPKPHDATEVTKKILSNEMSVSPLFRGFVDPNIGYHTSQDQTVYQGHYNGATNIWNGHSNFVNHDGVPEFTGDGYQNVYSYSPYSSYPSPSSPDPTLGQDVRPYGPHHYPYLGPFYQQPTPMSNGYGNGNSNRSSASASSRTGHQNSLLASNHSFYADQMFAFDAAPSPFQWFDGAYGGYHVPLTTSSFSSPSSFISAGNQDNRPSPHYMGFQTPRPYNQLYGQYGSTLRSSLNFESNKVNSRIYGQSMGRGNGLYNRNNPNLDEFGEMNCGPRAGHIKTPNTTIAVASVEKEDSGAVVPNKEHHNGEDLHDVYSDAKFFIIKSYSEDDIHRSIKYSVWASTPNGNKKLDAAYSESQGKASGCPVFLFFSVNASGQFVGVAEMVGPVEFDKNVDYWQHDKWIGCFPMKWHVIKDVPNNILKHIILENNDNKPVTNSRDTQEVKLEQGLEMLKIFKEHSSKMSIFDDFAFYDDRQKRMQEKKAKQLQLSNQAVDEKINKSDEKGKDDTNDKHFESVSSCENDKSQVDPEEQKPLEENHVADQVAEDALKPNN